SSSGSSSLSARTRIGYSAILLVRLSCATWLWLFMAAHIQAVCWGYKRVLGAFLGKRVGDGRKATITHDKCLLQKNHSGAYTSEPQQEGSLLVPLTGGSHDVLLHSRRAVLTPAIWSGRSPDCSAGDAGAAALYVVPTVRAARTRASGA